MKSCWLHMSVMAVSHMNSQELRSLHKIKPARKVNILSGSTNYMATHKKRANQPSPRGHKERRGMNWEMLRGRRRGKVIV